MKVFVVVAVALAATCSAQASYEVAAQSGNAAFDNLDMTYRNDSAGTGYAVLVRNPSSEEPVRLGGTAGNHTLNFLSEPAEFNLGLRIPGDKKAITISAGSGTPGFFLQELQTQLFKLIFKGGDGSGFYACNTTLDNAHAVQVYHTTKINTKPVDCAVIHLYAYPL